MNLSRNIILSLKDRFETDLSNAGYDFTFVSSWSEDNKIVMPDDYVADQNMIKLPAGNITLTNENLDRPYEMGGGSSYFLYAGSIFVHAITEGQLYDLLDLFLDSLTKDGSFYGRVIIPIYDFSSTGYPSTSATQTNEIEIMAARKTPKIDLSEQNVALKFGGLVGFSFRLLKG